MENILKPTDKLLLGVSGGMDSVVMADLFSKAKLKFGIAHCNFELRGNESDEDNSFVELLAKKYKVPFHSKKFDTSNYSEKNSISIQVAARELRINWFEELILKHDYTYYATAHHLDDQIETILNNFFRGTGISGLHGILPKRGNLIHPMLFCYRNQIEAYAAQHQLKHRTDSSNKKTDYTRNKIRHQLIPVIQSIYPNYQKTISDNIHRVRKVETIYRNHIHRIAKDLAKENNNFTIISIEKLLRFKPVEMYLYELIAPFGFNYANAEDIINSIDSNSGKYFLSDTHKITKDRTDLIIEERIENIYPKYSIEKGKEVVLDPVKLKLLYQNRTADLIISKNPNIANLDYDKLKFPLVLRKWRKGDYFYPLGMTQKKLVSDFFIDNKIPVPVKEKTWLLLSDEQIVWITGLRIDNRYKITDSTTNILAIEFFEN